MLVVRRALLHDTEQQLRAQDEHVQAAIARGRAQIRRRVRDAPGLVELKIGVVRIARLRRADGGDVRARLDVRVQHVPQREVRHEVAVGQDDVLLPDAAQIVHHARKRFHAPAEAPVPAAALAVGKRRQQRQAAVVAAEIPALARAEVIHHALALAVHDDAHVAHPGVDHAREREIHHAVVPRERDRPVDAVLDQLAQLRLLFIGENNPVHAVHASTSP